MKPKHRRLQLPLVGRDGLIHIGITNTRRPKEAMLGKQFHPQCSTLLERMERVDDVPTCVFCIGWASTW